jgi:hypothetical protein
MMKKILSAITIAFLALQMISGQTKEITGKPIAEIFTDFHVNINDTSRFTGFDLNRAYLGYQFLPEGNFSAKIIFNVGSPEDLADGSKSRRYSYFREASLTWTKNNLSVSMGMTGTKIFEFQQKFWGKRYVANTYQSINGYGYVADLGIAAEYKINNIFSTEFTLMNGEGYSNLQIDNNLRASLGITITPSAAIAIRIYGDIQKSHGLWQPLAICFIGFKNDLFTIGSELSYKSNIDLIRGHHAWGFSTTGGYNLSEKIEIFGRYDYSSSFTMPDDLLKWNFNKDGSFIVTGIQYTFSPNVRIALDYQGTYPYNPNRLATELVYLNALFKF